MIFFFFFVVILVFPRAFSAYQLCEKMHLREVFKRDKKDKKDLLWSCQSISSATGQGLDGASCL